MSEALQGTPEWLQARVGRLTASRIAEATARTRTGWGASRDNLIAELVVERLTGQPAPSYVSPAMLWGTETEPAARAAYEFLTNTTVTLVGFIEHPRIAMSGASPDGLLSDDGLIEIKCPNSAQHIATLLGAPIDLKYLKQMAWQMSTTGRAWCDFVSFDPRMPATMQLHVARVTRDDAAIRVLELEAVDFLDEVAAKVAALRARYNMQDAA